jgi:hypothetical protein
MKELIEDDLRETQSSIKTTKTYLNNLYLERKSICESILRNENDLDRLKLREEILKQKLKQIDK